LTHMRQKVALRAKLLECVQSSGAFPSAHPYVLRCTRRHEANPKRTAAYSSPRVIHRSEESLGVAFPAASVNNSAAGLAAFDKIFFPHPENTHRPVTNCAARRWTSGHSPSNRAMRWSATNTQWQTATSRSH
jgi:hypothetical protein